MGSVRQVYQLLNELEVAYGDRRDVSHILIQLSEIVECEVRDFLQYLDPFDRSFQSCSLGQIKEAVSGHQTVELLIAEQYTEIHDVELLIAEQYTEIYDVKLKTALCRLLLTTLSLFDGHLENIFKRESFVLQLFQWVENGPNPLRSYATGLLAEANRWIRYAEHRSKNSNLLPLILKRLHELGEQNINADDRMHNLNYMGHYEQDDAAHNKVRKIKSKSRHCPMFSDTRSKLNERRSKRPPIGVGLQNGSSLHFGEHVNTSHQVFPSAPVMEEMYILKYLTSVQHCQENIEEILKGNLMTFMLRYIDLRQNQDLTLAFEALKYFASLLRHNSAAMEFLGRGGLQLLLKLRCSALTAAGVSQCICALGVIKQAMLMICMEPSISKSDLVNCALCLLECPYKSCKRFSAKFLRKGFRFKAILEHFDQQDGLKTLCNAMKKMHKFGRPKIFHYKKTAISICKSLNRYFEAHLAALVEEKAVENSIRSNKNASVTRNLKLNIDKRNMRRLHDRFLTPLPQWKPVDEFTNLNGINILLQLIASYCKGVGSKFRARVETITNALGILKTCALTASALLQFCEKIPNPDHLHLTGVNILLHAAKGLVLPVAEVQSSALITIINCVCTKNESFYHINSPLTPKEAQVQVILYKLWENIIYEEGISRLVNILYTNVPPTDADSIRSLACKALCGLARLEIVKQILSEDPLVTKHHLIGLMKEPVHQDKRHYYNTFCKYGLKLLETVTGSPAAFRSQSTMNLNEISEPEISENSKSVHDDEKISQPVNDYPLQKRFTIPRLQNERRNALANKIKSNGFAVPQNEKEEMPTGINSKELTTSRLQNEKQGGSSTGIKSEGFVTSPTECDRFISGNTSRQSKFQRYEKSSNFTDTFKVSGSSSSYQSRLRNGFEHEEWITNHIHCNYRLKGLHGTDERSAHATCACFNTNRESHPEIVIGTSEGEIKVININSFEEVIGKNCCRDGKILHVESKNPLLITSDTDNSSSLWNFTWTDIERIHRFDGAFHMEFGKLDILRIITTNRNASVIYDINTLSQLQIFPAADPSGSYENNNAATFDFSDSLVLSDGLLYDVRSGELLQRFEKFDSKRNGVFHPNGREIICNSVIWDVRNFKPVRRVDELDRCRVAFNESGTVLYAAKETEDANCFCIFDACGYIKISTVDVGRSVRSVCCDPDNRHAAAIVGNSESPLRDPSFCRLYQVGPSEQVGDDSDVDSQHETDQSSSCEEEEMEY